MVEEDPIVFEVNEDGKCRAQVCRLFLYEAGRKDLAARVGTNRAGNPMRPPEALNVEDAALVAMAFRAAHEGNPAAMFKHEDPELAFQLPVTIEGGVRHWSPRGGVWCAWPDRLEYV